MIATLFFMSVVSCSYSTKKEKNCIERKEINCESTIEDFQIQEESKINSWEEIEKIVEEKTKEPVCDLFFMNRTEDTREFRDERFKNDTEDKHSTAFVFTGTKRKEEKGINFQGSLWYVDGQDSILLKNNIQIFPYEPVVIENEMVKYLLFTITSDSSTFISYIYSVKEEKPKLVLETPNICFMDKGRLVIIKTFISNAAKGRIWQRYYLYWDSEKEKYQEYIGRAITEEEFLRYENAQEINNNVETAIKEDIIHSYKEDSIDKVERDYIKRDNGIINGNYTMFCKENVYYFYTIMIEQDGKIDLETKNYNIYENGYIFESGGFDF